MRPANAVVLIAIAALALAPAAATAQGPGRAEAAADSAQRHRIRPAFALGFGYQPQVTWDNFGHVAAGFAYNVAADVDIHPSVRLGIQVNHLPWEMLDSEFSPEQRHGGMTLIVGSIGGRVLFGTAVPLWLNLGAGTFRLTREEYPATHLPDGVQPAMATVDPALTAAAYFDFRTRWTPVTIRGGGDATWIYFGEDSGLARSRVFGVRLAVAYRF